MTSSSSPWFEDRSASTSASQSSPSPSPSSHGHHRRHHYHHHHHHEQPVVGHKRHQRPDQGPNVDIVEASAWWDRHWDLLHTLFFKANDVIVANSAQYRLFRTFLHKYVSFMKRKQRKRHDDEDQGAVTGESPCKRVITANSDTTTRPRDRSDKGNVVDDDDVTRRWNFHVNTDHHMLSLYVGHNQRYANDKWAQECVEAFRCALMSYVDFASKKAFQTVQQLAKARSMLPIAEHEPTLVSTVHRHQVTLVAGDTGSGKSTQVPIYLVGAGYSHIVVTQPRRIAAISLARRVSFETHNTYGSAIAHQVRFETTKTADTDVLFVTEGLLLRQLVTDPLLSQYQVIILDEVHERHLPCDFLLGIIKTILPRRPELKLILMSATVNIELFTTYFPQCQVVRVPGRIHPIQVHWIADERMDEHDDSHLLQSRDKRQKPTQSIATTPNSRHRNRLDPNVYLRIIQRIDREFGGERGDVLIFLDGMSNMQLVYESLHTHAMRTKKWIILMLHSSLSVEEQDRVFHVAPDGVRKCVISTNLAESSVTIDGIRFVIDSGKAKEMTWDPTTRMSSLQECWISKASAEQRKGRAGRTGPGICYRVYSRAEYNHFHEYSVPEILRTPLDSTILQIKALSLADPRHFPFLESPPNVQIDASVLSLQSAGALDVDEVITPLGSVLAMLPLDIPMAKMLVYATAFHVLDPVITIASGLSVQSPLIHNSARGRRGGRTRGGRSLSHFDRVSAKEAPSPFAEFTSANQGDPFTLLNVFDQWIAVKAQRSRSSRRWAVEHHLEEQRLFEMTKLKKQFKQTLIDAGLVDRRDERQWSAFTVTDARRHHQHGQRWSHRGGARGGSGAQVPHSSAHRPPLDTRAHERQSMGLPTTFASSSIGKHSHDERNAKRASRWDQSPNEGANVGLESASRSALLQLKRHLELQKRIAGRRRQQLAWPTGEGNNVSSGSKSDDGNSNSVADGPSPSPSIDEIDFHLSHDLQQLVNQCQRNITKADMLLIQWIIAAGLHPNVCLPDPSNGQRAPEHLVFHARHKQYLHIHPASVYAEHGNDAIPPNSAIFYVKLLKLGGKPYLTNMMCFPCAQSMLLLAHRMDMSHDTCKILIDDWILITFHDAATSRHLVQLAHALRSQLRRLLTIQVTGLHNAAATGANVERGSDAWRSAATQELPADVPDWLRVLRAECVPTTTSRESDEDTDVVDPMERLAQQRLQQPQPQQPTQSATATRDEEAHVNAEDLAADLAHFLSLSIPYIVERIPASDLRGMIHLHSDPPPLVLEEANVDTSGLSTMLNLERIQAQEAAHLDAFKEGVRITPYLRWGSVRKERLVGDASVTMRLRRQWTCDSCGCDMRVNAQELMQHRLQCKSTSS